MCECIFGVFVCFGVIGFGFGCYVVVFRVCGICFVLFDLIIDWLSVFKCCNGVVGVVCMFIYRLVVCFVLLFVGGNMMFGVFLCCMMIFVVYMVDCCCYFCGGDLFRVWFWEV